MEKWSRIKYQPNIGLYEDDKKVTGSIEHINISKEAANEGAVLLKNDDKILPLKKGCNVVFFGKGCADYVKGGGGSGDVTVSYVRDIVSGFKKLGIVNVYEDLYTYYKNEVQKQYDTGRVPGMIEEVDIPDNLLKEAVNFADIAVVVISRFSGEGWDRKIAGVEATEDRKETWVDPMVLESEKLFPKGDFYLTDKEENMLSKVKENFENIVVVLNVGGMVDSKWFAYDDKIKAALMAFQGGMEGGLSVAELMCGVVTPSGKLTDTYACDLTDYPSTESFHESDNYVNYTEDIYVGYRYFETIKDAYKKVIYPFGYGLSYTNFKIELCDMSVSILDDEGNLIGNITKDNKNTSQGSYGGESLFGKIKKAVKNVSSENNDNIKNNIYIPKDYLDKYTNIKVNISARVSNIGDFEGKEVVEVYVNAPSKKMQKPKKVLAGFKKTKSLGEGEESLVNISFNLDDIASYDDIGDIEKSSYILEEGKYIVYVGENIRDERISFSIELCANVITKKLSEKLSPVALSKRMLMDGSYKELPIIEERDINKTSLSPNPLRNDGLSPEVRYVEPIKLWDMSDAPKKLIDVARGEITLDEFMSGLSVDDMISLLGGQMNTGVANTFGMGNLPKFGVPNAMTADGPAGLRIQPEVGVKTTAFPCATLIASTWNTDTAYEVGRAAAEEVKENNIAIWLTPAINIHRSPLCGRNFEYYSEDPYLTGEMASAMVEGIQSMHIAASVKHFALNNKETNRNESDSRASERAIREIYLKAFEIVVKKAKPWTIMSSYNAINGIRASESKELLTDILRNEWGFDGLVTTDWWGHGEQYKETIAGGDIKMGLGFPDRMKEALRKDLVTEDEIRVCARRVLELILKFD